MPSPDQKICSRANFTFLALAFPVLFVLFAMVVNVGLLVNQKINLQNSTDLAAYYGAMKQAQVLNAIAHVNYQIHQSWKLLVFRYRQIGTAGEAFQHPYDHVKDSFRASSSQDSSFTQTCPTAFCINYTAFAQMSGSESYCQNMCGDTKIPLPGAPTDNGISYGGAAILLAAVTSQIVQYSQNALQQVQFQCQKSSALNWLLLAEYLWLYKADMVNRKRILNRLANSLSYSTTSFLDIDAGQVGGSKAGQPGLSTDGVYKTFYNNLTEQNQTSIGQNGTGQGTDFQFYNSLGADACKGTEGNENAPPLWLKEVFSKPIFAFREADCDDPIKFFTKVINAGKDNLPRYKDQIPQETLNFLSQYITDPVDLSSDINRLYHTTLNYEKNPWCMAYVQVTAKTQPKIPFLPFKPVTLVASSTAKPFGASIGPWYYKNWPVGQPTSIGGLNERIDKALPPRADTNTTGAAPTDESLKADYGRYVGDAVGTKSNITMGRLAQAIYEKDKDPNRIKVEYWIDLLGQDFSSNKGNGDLLAWDKSTNSAPPIRKIEVSAIIPDQFDSTYYSIEPDFWRNYAIRLARRSDFQSSQLAVRGDIGFRSDAPDKVWQKFTIRDQVEMARTANLIDYNTLNYYVGSGSGKQAYFEELLTSWHYKFPGDYTIDQTNRFGKCPSDAVIDPSQDSSDAVSIGRAVPGSCFAGGRVGYSVKLVDPQFLQSGNLELGGEGIVGPLSNPPTYPQ